MAGEDKAPLEAIWADNDDRSDVAEPALVVDVDGFEGPLDLLLHLARNQKVDLARISVLALAEQYIAFIESARQLRIELRSEIVAVFADGALVAAAPDLLCLLDVSRSELATLDSLEPGDLVDVLVTPADAMWYAPEGMAMVGLESHGIPLELPRRR